MRCWFLRKIQRAGMERNYTGLHFMPCCTFQWNNFCGMAEREIHFTVLAHTPFLFFPLSFLFDPATSPSLVLPGAGGSTREIRQSLATFVQVVGILF